MANDDSIANPVTRLREAKLGVSKAEFCRRSGCTYADVVKVEGGYVQRLPQRISEIMARYGVDDADERYVRWRNSLQREDGLAMTDASTTGKAMGG